MTMREMQQMLSDIEWEVKLTRNMIGKAALSDRVMAAMKHVPRHKFIPDALREYAYQNGPVPIGFGQTISQPYIVALMSDLLNTKPSDIVLEIGTGSGYQAAILSELVRQVYSIEVIEDLATMARAHLHALGYDNVEVRAGDGNLGWPEHAPYDGIIVTAAAPHIPQALIDQLRTGARLVIPLGQPYSAQELMVVEKKSNGEIETQDVLSVAFVPLVEGRNTSSSHQPDRHNPM
jgi:protein-L-isoaspartate(D-aspartate) O-methyltransferase